MTDNELRKLVASNSRVIQARGDNIADDERCPPANLGESRSSN